MVTINITEKKLVCIYPTLKATMIIFWVIQLNKLHSVLLFFSIHALNFTIHSFIVWVEEKYSVLSETKTDLLEYYGILFAASKRRSRYISPTREGKMHYSIVQNVPSLFVR